MHASVFIIEYQLFVHIVNFVIFKLETLYEVKIATSFKF